MAGGAVARKHVAADAPQCPEGHDDALPRYQPRAARGERGGPDDVGPGGGKGSLEPGAGYAKPAGAPGWARIRGGQKPPMNANSPWVHSAELLAPVLKAGAVSPHLMNPINRGGARRQAAAGGHIWRLFIEHPSLVPIIYRTHTTQSHRTHSVCWTQALDLPRFQVRGGTPRCAACAPPRTRERSLLSPS